MLNEMEMLAIQQMYLIVCQIIKEIFTNLFLIYSS